MLKIVRKKSVFRGLTVIYALVFLLTTFSFNLKVNAAPTITLLYVSPMGDDSNPGTIDEPFKTIEKAKQVVRGLSNSMTSDVIVWLRGGTYTLTDTLIFTEEDSGKNGYYVRYMNYPGEAPVISGGANITGWAHWENGIYRAECGDMEFRQLYVEGTKAVRARTPNVGTYHRLVSWDTTNKTIRVNADELSDCQNLANGKVEMAVQQYWGCSIMRIASVAGNDSYRHITVNSTEGDVVFGREWPRKSPEQPYHFENSLDFIDEGGEWYLDNNTSPHYLYYMPHEGEDINSTTVIAPSVETLISVKGSSLGAKASHIVFQGITFEHSNWNRPTNNGYIGLQQQQYSIGGDRSERPEAALYIKNAHHMDITRNIFRNMGSTGLDIYTGTNNITIQGNVFYDIAGNGMQIGKFSESDSTIATPYNPPDTREYCDAVTIANNYIHNVAQEYYDGCGISAGYVRNINIVHNEVTNLPYTGISVGWGWNSQVCAMTNNHIEYNHIYNVINLLADGAGIYTLANQGPASTIKYNYIHDISRSVWATTPYTPTYPIAGVYLDEGSSGYTIDRNCINNVEEKWRINYNKSKDRNTEGVNPYDDADIISNAGLEAAYADIKTADVPGIASPVWTQGSTLTATDVSESGVTLTWTSAEDETGVTGYKIYKNSELIKTVDGNVNSYIVTGLTAGTDFRFSVQAGNSKDSWSVDGPIVLITTEGIDTESLSQEVVKANNLLAEIPIGSEEGQYASWAKEYLEKSILDAQNYLNSGGLTREGLELQLNKLIAAGEVFKKTQVTVSSIALKKPVTSSDGDNINIEHSPSKAVDGSSSHMSGWESTSSQSMKAWLQIDLEGEYLINRVEYDDRTNFDWIGYRSNFEIWASNDPTFETYEVLGGVGAEGFEDDTTWVLNVTDQNSYRYIRFQRTVQEYTYLTELRVFGVPESEKYTIGGNVVDSSQQPVSGASVTIYSFDDQTTPLGTTITAADGTYTIDTEHAAGKYIVRADKEGYNKGISTVYIPYSDVDNALITLTPMVNVALNKPVTSSDGDNISTEHPPAKVVDGSSSHMNGWDCNLSGSIKPWVQIDLEDEYIITRIEYDDRTEFDWIGYRNNFEFQVSNDPTFETYEVLGGVGPEGFEDDTTWILDVTDETPYRYVRFQRTSTEYIYVVEIRVFGTLSTTTPLEDTTAPEWPDGSDITVSNLSSTGVTLTWPAAIDDTAVIGYKIYKDSELIDTVAGSVNSYNVTGLTAETEYTFTVQAVDAAGNESTAGPTVTATTISEETQQFTIGVPVFKNANGNIMAHLTASADLKASIDITNNLEEPQNACFIVALYAPDNALKAYSAGEGVVQGKRTITFKSYFPLPDDVTGYYVKVLVWDSLEGMIPISNSITFE